MKVIISRDNTDFTQRADGTYEPKVRGRVFITGPYFQPIGGLTGHYIEAVYSSTPDRNEASQFDRSVAESLLDAGKWTHWRPEIHEVTTKKKASTK